MDEAVDETAAKDALLLAVLPNVPFDGWSRAAALGSNAAELAALFPAGPRDLVAWFSRWADLRALEALAALDLAPMKVRERIASGVLTRLRLLEPHREATRRALAFLALPLNVPLGLRLLYDTVDALWHAAGDTATDFSFYTKRGLLAGVVAATTLYWLDDRSLDMSETHVFLERRLGNVMALPRLGRRLGAAADRLPNPFRLMRAAGRR